MGEATRLNCLGFSGSFHRLPLRQVGGPRLCEAQRHCNGTVLSTPLLIPDTTSRSLSFMASPRIVSLLPSCTEIVCALGLGPSLVGRSHECDFPPEVNSLPVCTKARMDISGDSASIDRQVKNLLENSLSIYQIDVPLIEELQPDFILTQAQCEVCAVSLADVESALQSSTTIRAKVLSSAPTRFADLWSEIGGMAQALGVEEAGCRVIKVLKSRVVDVIEKLGVAKRRPSVACIEWLEPLMAAGNWVPELVELAGGVNLFGEAGKHSPWMKWKELAEVDPEFIIAMPCGFDLERTQREMRFLTERPEWLQLRAVKRNQVHVTDGNQFFNRPGPRLVDSLEILAEILHPEIFKFGYEGRGWRQWSS